MKRYIRAVAAIAACFPVAAQATPNGTPAGYITFMAGGWTNALSRVQTDFTFTNPENCGYTDGYVVDPADSGNALFSSMLLSAYMSHRKVSFVIDGCSYSHPHIISVNLWPN